MKDTINYIQVDYTSEELEDLFIHEFTQFRKENNLTQELFALYTNVNREKIARIENKMHSPTIHNLLKILGPLGYTVKIVKQNKKRF